jgi:hypothetical protein
MADAAQPTGDASSFAEAAEKNLEKLEGQEGQEARLSHIVLAGVASAQASLALYYQREAEMASD